MRIDWWTLALQAANFLVLVWLLQHFLYRPVQAVIAQRQQQADSLLVEANAAKTAAEELRAELETQRAAIDRERHQALEKAHAKAKDEAASLLDRARADAEKLLVEERRRTEQERAEVCSSEMACPPTASATSGSSAIRAPGSVEPGSGLKLPIPSTASDPHSEQ